MFRRAKTTKAKGIALEKRVLAMYERFGKSNLQRSVFLKDSRGNRSEIDVVFGRFWWKRYVECKNYSPDHPVPLEVMNCAWFPCLTLAASCR
jgi:hypothetical protein